MPTYYFDPVTGSDLNNGLAASAPLQGISPPITDYMVTGNTLRFKRGAVFGESSGMIRLWVSGVSGLTMESYGDGLLPPQFEARTAIPSESWVYTGAGNIWYRQRPFTRQVQRVFVGSDNVELLESSFRNGGVADIDGSKTFWYWAIDDPSFGSDRLYMWSGSPTLNPTQMWGSVMICDLSTAYASGASQFANCSDIVFRDLRISGVISDHIILTGGNNFLLDGVVLDFAPLRGQSLRVQASTTADANNVEILNTRFLTSGVYRNFFSESGASNNTDPNCDPDRPAPFRSNTPNDTIRLLCPGKVTIRNSFIEAGNHSGINIFPQNRSGRQGDVDLELTDCEIVCSTMGPYSRAFGFQRSALGGAGRIVMTGNRIARQSIHSQIAGCTSAYIGRNVFGPCDAPVKELEDYYNNGIVYTRNEASAHIAFSTYEGCNAYGAAGSVSVEENHFQGSGSAPLQARFIDGEAPAGVFVIRRNHFSNTSDPWRSQTPAPRLLERRFAGSWVPVFEDNTYEGNYNPVIGLASSTSWHETPVTEYGAGNVEMAKERPRPLIAARRTSMARA